MKYKWWILLGVTMFVLGYLADPTRIVWILVLRGILSAGLVMFLKKVCK